MIELVSRIMTPDRPYGGIYVVVPRDHFPGDPDPHFGGVWIDRFDDVAHEWQPYGFMEYTGKVRPFSSILYRHNNGEGYAVPQTGLLRIRAKAKRRIATDLQIRLLPDPGLPPPLKPIHHSVAHAGTDITAVTNFTTTFSIGNKSTTGSDRCSVLHLGMSIDEDTQSITSVDYAGTAGMTLFHSLYDEGLSFYAAYLYSVVAPPTGSSAVTVNADDDVRGVAGVSSFEGVDQTNNGFNVGSAVDDGPTDSAISQNVNAPVGDMAVDAWISNESGSVAGVTCGQNQVQLAVVNPPDDPVGGGSYKAGEGAATNMAWTGVTNDYVWVGGALKAAGGGGLTTEYVAPTVLQAGVAMIGRRYV